MIRMFLSLLIGTAFMASATGIVKETLPVESDEPVKQLLKKYKEKGPIQIKLRKKLKSPYKVKESVSEGTLMIKGQKLRLEMNKPDHSVVVVDGKHVWIQQETMGLEKAQVLVTKFPINNRVKAEAVLSLLFNKESNLEAFNFMKYQKDDEREIFTFVPKSAGAEYENIEIAIKNKEGRILSLSYEDSLENQVTYDFGVTTFEAKLKDKEFRYEPPKGAEVDDLSKAKN